VALENVTHHIAQSKAFSSQIGMVVDRMCVRAGTFRRTTVSNFPESHSHTAAVAAFVYFGVFSF
jgi:hypothetical protein